MKYFEIESPLTDDHVIEIIAANNHYEAYGYFVDKYQSQIPCVEDVLIRDEYNEYHKVEVSCIGFPIYKTLKELYEEKEESLPCFICSVWE